MNPTPPQSRDDQVQALALEAGVSEETARHALICNLVLNRIEVARARFFREHGETPETAAAWVAAMARVIGVGSTGSEENP